MKEEASRCRKIAKRYLTENNRRAAEYYLLKSLEMDENPEARFLIKKMRSAEISQPVLNWKSRSAYECAKDHYDDGKYGDAVYWFHRCLQEKNSSELPNVLYSLALIYLNWNRPERSRRYLNLALKYRKGFHKAERLLAAIEIA